MPTYYIFYDTNEVDGICDPQLHTNIITGSFVTLNKQLGLTKLMIEYTKEYDDYIQLPVQYKIVKYQCDKEPLSDVVYIKMYEEMDQQYFESKLYVSDSKIEDIIVDEHSKIKLFHELDAKKNRCDAAYKMYYESLDDGWGFIAENYDSCCEYYGRIIILPLRVLS